MTAPANEFFRELATLSALPRGPAKVAQLSDLARRTESAGRPSDLRAARWELLIAAVQTELGDDAVLPTFAALLADFDADPAAASDYSRPDRLLTAYAEVLRYTTRYPSIPKATIESLLDDFARRVAEWGGDAADAYETRLHARGTLGDLEAVPALCVAMTRAREAAGLPPARDAEALAGIYTAQPLRSLAAMRPAIAGTDPDAWRWRSTFLDWSLRPLVWAGEEEEADRNFAEAARRSSTWLFGDILLLEYSARRWVRDGWAETAEPLARVGRLLDAAPDLGPSFRGQAQQACGLALEAFAAVHDDERRAFAVPGTGGDVMRPSEAATVLLSEAEARDREFAARNGNDYLGTEFAGNRQFVFGPGSGIDRVPADRRDRLRVLWEEAEAAGR